MNLDFVVALEKRATLFSYSRSVKHIVHFYFLRDFDIGICTIFLNSKRTAIQMKRICRARYYLLFLATRFENIVHFYFVRTLILVGTIFTFKFDMHCARNPNLLTKR